MPVSKKDAIAAGLMYYFTGTPCKHGHVGEQYASATGHGCVVCIRARQAAWWRDNPDEVYAKQRVKRDKAIAEKAEWRRANPFNSFVKAKAASARRRSRKLQRTPTWANRDKILEAYKLADFMSDLMQTPYHVDHEIPLQSKLVSGLHVHTNLRVIPGVENLRKHNRFTPYAESF